MRELKLFAIGVGALLVVGLVYAELRLALLTFAAAVLALVAGGFRRRLPLYLPALPDWDGDEVAVGIRPQPYPQLFLFSAELRNLYILILAPLYSLGVVAWVMSQSWLTLNDLLNEDRGVLDVFIMRGVGMLTASVVLIAWWWFSERLLLWRSAGRLGIVHSEMGAGELSYEYFDTEGQRRGGTAKVWGEVTGEIMPVFVHEARGDWSKPGFGFLFHRFAITDSRHVAAAAGEWGLATPVEAPGFRAILFS